MLRIAPISRILQAAPAKRVVRERLLHSASDGLDAGISRQVAAGLLDVGATLVSPSRSSEIARDTSVAPAEEQRKKAPQDRAELT
jgi:hypothetical protein